VENNMSDPQHSDVEDVLSSIRRLVSEDKRPLAEAPVDPVPDRLVLTPALRVAEPDADEPDVDVDIALPDAAPETDAWMAPPPDDAPVEDAAGGLDLQEDNDAEDMSWPDEASGSDPEPEQDSPGADAPDMAFTSSQTLSDKIAALEEVIARRDDAYEPDDAGADAYAGTDEGHMEWEDATPDPEPPHMSDAAPDILASDEDVLDEDALRDLVADIVREELQGALGERITRNVRKLVRREIHRALAAQDLD